MSLTLGIDLDGVVCDFPSAANDYLCSELECSPLPVDKWDWYKGYGEAVEPVWQRLWDEVVPGGFFLTVDEVSGACDALDHLRRQGHTLVFCTARPMCGAVDTEAWLEMHGFAGHPLFVTADSKAKQHMGVDLLIDDKSATIRKHLSLGKHAVLFKQPWNRDHWHKVPSVSGWGEVIGLVEAMDCG